MQIALKLALVALCTAGLAATGCTSDRETSDAKLLVNRIWVDKLPKKETDYFELLVLVQDDPVGLFRRASQYEGDYALFRYEVRGDDKLQLMFPQNKSKHEAKYKARACDEKDFDYCLDLDGAPRGVKRYLSRKEWELDADADELEERLQQWRESLPSD